MNSLFKQVIPMQEMLIGNEWIDHTVIEKYTFL